MREEGTIMGFESCLTPDVRALIKGVVEKGAEPSVILGLIDTIPNCVAPTVPAAKEAATRKLPQIWGIQPVYFDEKGKREKFSSPSALVKHLGLPMSGIQCDAEGKKCRAQNAVEILQIHNYVVSGNGEPKKAAEGGKKLTVWHPNSPKLKKEETAA
jgi:hypothetical protein